MKNMKYSIKTKLLPTLLATLFAVTLSIQLAVSANASAPIKVVTPAEPVAMENVSPTVPVALADVTPDDWFFSYVSFVRENNIMQGTSETTFSPNQGFTRAQVAATLFRIHFGRAADATDPRANEFTDVPENEWFAPYITWANANNIVSGIGNNLFAPADIITRQQFAVMLHRFARSFTNIDTAAGQNSEWRNFTDLEQVASWAMDALMWGHFRGIISGRTATTIEPAGVVTRADIAAMLTRLVRRMYIAENISADDFELTISVEETTWLPGERFRVNIELKNNSGACFEIVYDFLFFPRILGWNAFGNISVDPPHGSRFFETNSVIRSTSFWEHESASMSLVRQDIEPGIHELRVSAGFWIRDTGQRIDILSDPILLTVQ